MIISEFTSATDNIAKAKVISYEDFKAFCKSKTEERLIRGHTENQVKESPSAAREILTPVKKDQPCFSPCSYRKSIRAKKNVKEIYAYVADLDGIEPEMVIALFDNFEFDFFAYTTFGHGWSKQGECWRMVIPFASPIVLPEDDEDAEVWRSVWHRLNGEFIADLNDTSTCDASRLHFYPAAPYIVGNSDKGWFENSNPIFFEKETGKRLDAQQHLIDAIKSIEETKREEEERRKNYKPVDNEDRRRNWAVKSLEGIINYLETVQDGGKHNALCRMAFCAGGLIPDVSIEECRSGFAHILSTWKAQGKKIDNQFQARKTIESGLVKGQAKKLNPDASYSQYRPFDDLEHVGDDEADDWFNESKTESNSESNVIQLVKKPVEEVVATVSTGESLWAQFKSLSELNQTYGEELERRVEYRQPGIMVASGLALNSALAMRRIAFNGLCSQSIFCVIAGTSTGKGVPQGFLQECLLSAWPEILGPGDFSTSASFLDRITNATLLDHGLIYIVDEYGPTLKQMFNERNPMQAALRGILLKLATNNTGRISFAASRKEGGQDKILDAPAFAGYFSTAPESLMDALSTMSARDGYVGRHIWFSAEKILPIFNFDKRIEKPSEKLVQLISNQKQNWKDWQTTLPPCDKQADGIQRNFYSFETIEATSDAKKMLIEYRLKVDDRRRDSQTDEVTEGVIGRSVEHAMKIALGVANSRCKTNIKPIVDVDCVRFGINVIEYSNSIITSMMKMNSNDGQFQKDLSKVRRAIAKTPVPESMREWLRFTKLKKDVFNECVDWLISVNELSKETKQFIEKQKKNKKEA